MIVFSDRVGAVSVKQLGWIVAAWGIVVSIGILLIAIVVLPPGNLKTAVIVISGGTLAYVAVVLTRHFTRNR